VGFWRSRPQKSGRNDALSPLKSTATLTIGAKNSTIFNTMGLIKECEPVERGTGAASGDARHFEELSGRARAERREPVRLSGQGSGAGRRKRRGEIDADEDSLRHLQARRGRNNHKGKARPDRRAAGLAEPGHQHHLPGAERTQQRRHRREHLRRAGASAGRARRSQAPARARVGAFAARGADA